MSGSRTLLALAVAASSTLAAGCTAGPDQPRPSVPSVDPATHYAQAPVDPLVAATDPSSADLVAAHVGTVLDQRCRGPATFTLARPAVGSALRFYVACSPKSSFTVTVGTFFSGSCAPRFTNYGQFPLPSGSDPVSVTLELPESTDYWLTAISVDQG